VKRQVALPDDTVRSTEQLAKYATDLTDEQVRQVGSVIGSMNQRFSKKGNSVKNLEELRDEALTRLAEINILATVDPSPCFYGGAPIVDIVGAVNPNPAGFDHEKKQHEVQKAVELGEDYRGQKENPNKKRRRAKE
jgi:hypothetical protein